jgi:hypothetical protein
MQRLFKTKLQNAKEKASVTLTLLIFGLPIMPLNQKISRNNVGLPVSSISKFLVKLMIV